LRGQFEFLLASFPAAGEAEKDGQPLHLPWEDVGEIKGHAAGHVGIA
jgi:hypothetical protein